MVNKKEFEGYICEITNKPIREMRLCPDKFQKFIIRRKCDKSCIWCEMGRYVGTRAGTVGISFLLKRKGDSEDLC